MHEIIIRGKNSFIGKNIIKKKVKNKKIRIYNKNLISNKKSFFLHLSSQTSVPKSFKNPAETIKTNLNLLIETLEYCKKNKLKLIFFSTAYQKENGNFTSPYAYSKFLCENLCKIYSEKLKIDVCVLRLTNIYGKYQKKKLVPDIIKKMSKNKKINLVNYSLSRDYVYVDDLILALEKIVKFFPNGYNCFTISQNKNLKIIDVCSIIKVALNSKTKIVKKKNKNNQSFFKNKKIDSTKFRRKFKWFPKFNFEEGLKNIL